MSYPRKYPTPTSGTRLNENDWNAVVDRFNGFTPSGVFTIPYGFTILANDVGGITYYYANNAFQTVYGGPGTAGGVDGTNYLAVAQAANDYLHGAAGGTLAFKDLQLPAGLALDTDVCALQFYQGRLIVHNVGIRYAGWTGAVDFYPETNNTGCEFRLIPHGTPGTYYSEVTLLNSDVIADAINIELLVVQALGASGYRIQGQQYGTGSLRSISIDAMHGNPTFRVNTDGTIDMMDKLVVTKTDSVELDPLWGKIKVYATDPTLELAGKEAGARIFRIREKDGELHFCDETSGNVRWHMDNVGNLFPDVNDTYCVGVAGKRMRPFVKVFASAPALANMGVGEIALGDATGAGGADEIFIKASGGRISRFVADGTIT